MEQEPSPEEQAYAERKYELDLAHCIHKDCRGELFELMYDERNNWVTVVYKCAKCHRDFTVKIEI